VVRAEKLLPGQMSSTKKAEKRGRYSSVVGYSPDTNGMRTEVEESPLLKAVAKQRLVKILQAGEDLACSDM
jgi:hypothetical protein